MWGKFKEEGAIYSNQSPILGPLWEITSRTKLLIMLHSERERERRGEEREGNGNDGRGRPPCERAGERAREEIKHTTQMNRSCCLFFKQMEWQHQLCVEHDGREQRRGSPNSKIMRETSVKWGLGLVQRNWGEAIFRHIGFEGISKWARGT